MPSVTISQLSLCTRPCVRWTQQWARWQASAVTWLPLLSVCHSWLNEHTDARVSALLPGIDRMLKTVWLLLPIASGPLLASSFITLSLLMCTICAHTFPPPSLRSGYYKPNPDHPQHNHELTRREARLTLPSNHENSSAGPTGGWAASSLGHVGTEEF